MRKYSPFFLFLVSLACCCGKSGGETPDPGPVAPTAIILDASTVNAPAEGVEQDILIQAPGRPTVQIPSSAKSWLSFSEKGIYKNYALTVTIKVAANEKYESRSAEITVSSKGAENKTIMVSQEAKEVIPDPVLPDNDAVAMSNALALGWNMGNHFDAYYNGSWAGDREGYPSETAWQPNLATQALFDAVKAAGFTSVRIPVSWLRTIGEAPDYAIEETWINRVYEVVQFAHNAGLKVIINMHHDENHGLDNTYQWQDIKKAAKDPALNAAIKAKITGAWTQIANKFKSCGTDWLIMEGFNEINDGGWGWSADFRANPHTQCDILNEWNQTFVDAVRATGGNNATRWLGVPSYAANPGFTQYMTLPNDPASRIMVSVHFYDPSEYTIGDTQYSDWGHTGAMDRKAPGSDEDHVKEVFNMLYTNYVSRNVPVYIGEFGCSMRNKADTRAWKFYLYYLEYVVKAAKAFGMPCFLWDNGAEGYGKEKHGYFNHGTGGFVGNSREPVQAMVKARNTVDASYTLQSVYDSAPKF